MADVMKTDDVDRGWAWVTLSASSIILALMASVYTSVGFFQVEFLETFRSSQGLVALTGSVYLSTLYIFGPIAGIVCDLLTHRVSIMTGGALVSVALVSASFCQDFISLLFFYGIVCGVGAGLCYTPTVTVISTYFHKYRTFATGVCMAAPGVGILGAPYFVGWMIETYGWRQAMAYFGCVIAQVCVLASLFFPRVPTPTPACCRATCTRRQDDSQDPEDLVQASIPSSGLKEDLRAERSSMMGSQLTLRISEMGSVMHSQFSIAHSAQDVVVTARIGFRIKRLLRRKVLWIICLNQTLMIAAYAITIVLFPAFYRSVGLTLSDVGFLYITYGISVTVSRILGGFVFSFIPHHLIRALFCVELGYAATLALLPLCSSFPALLVCKLFIGMTYGPSFSLLAPILIRYVGLEDLSIAFGTVLLSVSVGSLVAPPIAGVLYDSIGNYGVCFFVAGSIIGASALSLLLLVFLKDLEPFEETSSKGHTRSAKQEQSLLSTNQKECDSLTSEQLKKTNQ